MPAAVPPPPPQAVVHSQVLELSQAAPLHWQAASNLVARHVPVGQVTRSGRQAPGGGSCQAAYKQTQQQVLMRAQTAPAAKEAIS